MSQSPDIFLSYSREDQAVARRIADAFEREGLRVWWDATLRSGEAYDEVTEQALRTARAVVVLWSARSVASRWVRAEATIALRNRTLVPVMIEPCDRPVMFELTQSADLAGWSGDARDRRWLELVADVKGFVDQTGGPRESAGAMPRPPVTARPASRRMTFVAVALGAILVGVAATLLLRDRAPAQSGTTAASVEVAPVVAPRTAVAVMPFANLTGDPSLDYMGDGLAVELINVLGKVPGLTVPSRTSTFAYRDRRFDLRQIARDLQVGTVLEGSVRSAGEVLRVTASLVDASTDRQLWTENYEHRFDDVFALQDELARAIVKALQGSLGEAPDRSLALAPTGDTEAYRLYLKAITLAAPFNESLSWLDEAIRRDPDFARAWAARAFTRSVMVVQGFAAPSALALVEADARHALELDDSLSEPHTARAFVAAFHADWLEAERSFQASLAAAPGEPVPRVTYAAILLQSVGQVRRGTQLVEETLRLAPTNDTVLMSAATQASMTGNHDEATRLADLANVAGWPDDRPPLTQVRANAAEHAGHPEQAAEYLKMGLQPAMRAAGAGEMVDALYHGLADPQLRGAALKSMDAFVRRVGVPVIDASLRKDILVAYVKLGDVDRAYTFMDHVLDDYAKQGVVGYAWGGLWIPEMAPFRRDGRFQKLVTRMRMPDYWRVQGAPDLCSFAADRLDCR